MTINKTALILASQVENNDDRERLIDGLSRFSVVDQIKYAKHYLSLIEEQRWWTQSAPTQKANDWFAELLQNTVERKSLDGYTFTPAAVAALKKINDNAQFNTVLDKLIAANKKRSLQASFVRQTAANLAFAEKLKQEYDAKRETITANQQDKIDKQKIASSARVLLDNVNDKDDFVFVNNALGALPKPLHARFLKRYLDYYQSGFGNKSRYKANRWLSRTIKVLKPRLEIIHDICQSMPLPWFILSNVEKTKQHAFKLAATAQKELMMLAESEPEWTISDYYHKMAEWALQYDVMLDKSEKGDNITDPDAEIALLKLTCDKWWARKLKRVRRQYLEHLEIACGQVGRDVFTVRKNNQYKQSRKGINAYCSKSALGEYISNKKSGEEFLKKFELVNQQNDVIELMKAVEAGIANPVNMRNELMLRIRETEELANEMGYVGGFYTQTCPSKYHAQSTKWNGATPKQAQNYLTRVFSQFRAKLDREEIPYFGIRVAEPHADGCPHWHMLLWMPERYFNQVNHLMRRYFTKAERGELLERFKNRKKLRAGYKKARRDWGFKKKCKKYAKEPLKNYNPSAPRFTVVKMKPPEERPDGTFTGGAAAYIAKYISKNIDGFKLADHEDADTGEMLQAAVNPVKAWASTWNIRQFQFQKSPSITIWRELRRQRNVVEHNEQLEQVRLAADEGRFKDFVKLMGGFGIGRDARFKTAYQTTPFGNQYGELVKRVKGVCDELTQTSLITREHEWHKQLIGTAKANAAVSDVQEAAFVGSADLSWTSGNNCTPIDSGDRATIKLKKIGFDDQRIERLINGERVLLNSQLFWLEDNNLREIDSIDPLQVASIADNLAIKHGLMRANSEQWRFALELVELTYSLAAKAGRDKPQQFTETNDKGVAVIGDHELARLLLDNKVSLPGEPTIEDEWWDLDVG